MKNLMVYINPHGFSSRYEWAGETGVLAKVQIENSLALGWSPEDIVVVTNFDYSYKGVEALRVDFDQTYCEFSPTASKVNAIIRLFELGLVKDDELWWFHDWDAFQLHWITEEEINLAQDEIGATDYGKSSINPGRDLRWSTGSIFFRSGSEDLFRLWRGVVYRYQANEEIALLEMLKKWRYRGIRHRVRKLNITYNLATRKRKIREAYEMADKPVRVLHFHPTDDRHLDCGGTNLDVLVRGKVPGTPRVTRRLAELFQCHGLI